MRVHATVQHRKPAQDTLDENATTLEAGLSTEVPAESSDSASAAPPPPEPLPLDNSSHKLRRSVQVYADEAFIERATASSTAVRRCPNTISLVARHSGALHMQALFTSMSHLG